MSAKRITVVEVSTGRYDICDTGVEETVWFWTESGSLVFIGTASTLAVAREICDRDGGRGIPYDRFKTPSPAPEPESEHA